MSKLSASEGEAQEAKRTFKLKDILMWKWANIMMDFMQGFPKPLKGHDVTWVTIDGFTKSAHFLSISMIFS